MNFFNIIKAVIRFYLMILLGLLELMYDVAAYLFPWYADDEKKIDDIAFCTLTSKDVVRHPLVQKIVKAYDDYEAKEKNRNDKSDE